MKTVLVLGANGGVGKVVAKAFLDKGWRVLGLVRAGKATGEGIVPIHADLFDASAVARATGPVDLVFNGLNVPYPVWAEKALPTYTAAADICEALNARQIYPGSVYNFGSSMPPILTPQTPFAADTLKGRIRVSIEGLFRERAEAGRLRTIVIRAGDFFGSEAPNSWMGALVAKDLGKGKIVTPGKKTTVHAWAFLPDLAATVVKLAEVEATLGAYEVFHFESQNVSAKRLADAAGMALSRKVAVGHMPRVLFSLIAMFDPFMRAALEMLYLWDVPHALEDPRLAEVIGELPHTPLSEAMKTLL
jgi:nucleoside-diphosphate-sugar epimerase